MASISDVRVEARVRWHWLLSLMARVLPIVARYNVATANHWLDWTVRRLRIDVRIGGGAWESAGIVFQANAADLMPNDVVRLDAGSDAGREGVVVDVKDGCVTVSVHGAVVTISRRSLTLMHRPGQGKL